MQIIELQEQIEILRGRLINEAENYRIAIQKDMDFDLVKSLFQKLKSIMGELKRLMTGYEKLITAEMTKFDKRKHAK